MRQGISIHILASIAAFAATDAHGTPWTVLGPRPMAMGGAYTAIAEGPIGAYWNPAGLGQVGEGNQNGFAFPVSVHGEFSGSVLEGANDINKLKDNCGGAGTPADCQARITAALNKMNEPGNGAMADAGTGLDFKFGRLAFFANSLGSVGGNPVVDLVRADPLTITNNTSRILVRGIQYTEFGVGYGRELWESGLLLGANLKGILGRTGFVDFRVAQEDPDASNVLRQFDRNKATSFRPGLDVGLLWDVRETWEGAWLRPRFGVVGRNINNPKFNQPDAATAAGERNKYSLEGQARAGIALSPFNFWHLAADVDLTDNLTAQRDYNSRQFGLGTEVNVFNRAWLNIPLRAGVSKNLSRGNSGVSWTGGFGLNFLHASVDLALSVSDKTTKLQTEVTSESIPNNAAASLQVAVLFGGRDYEAQPRRARPEPERPRPARIEEPPAAPARPIKSSSPPAPSAEPATGDPFRR